MGRPTASLFNLELAASLDLSSVARTSRLARQQFTEDIKSIVAGASQNLKGLENNAEAAAFVLANRLKAASGAIEADFRPVFDKLVQRVEAFPEVMRAGGQSIQDLQREVTQLAPQLVQLADSGFNRLSREVEAAGGDMAQVERRMDELGRAGLSLQQSVDQAAKEFRAFRDAEQRVVAAGKSTERFRRQVERLRRRGVAPLQAINQAARELTAGFGNLERLGSKLLITMGVLGSVRFIASDLFNMGRGIFEIGERAAKLADAEEGFRRLANQVGNAEVSLRRIRVAAGGTIDEFTLLENSTRAALAGLPIDRLDEMIIKTRALAAVTGVEASDALERFTGAVAKGEKELLDELGIIVSFNELQEDFAEKVGKSTLELTEQERVLARFEGVMEATSKQVEALGGIIEDNQRIFLQFRESVRNATIQVGEWINRQPLFIRTIKTLTSTIGEFGLAFADSETKIASSITRIDQFKKLLEEETDPALRQAIALQVILLEEGIREQQEEALEAESERLKVLNERRIAGEAVVRILREQVVQGRKVNTLNVGLINLFKTGKESGRSLEKALLDIGTLTLEKAIEEFQEIQREIEETEKRSDRLFNVLKEGATKIQPPQQLGAKEITAAAKSQAEAVEKANASTIASLESIAKFDAQILSVNRQAEIFTSTLLNLSGTNEATFNNLLGLFQAASSAFQQGQIEAGQAILQTLKQRLSATNLEQEVIERLIKFQEEVAKLEKQRQNELTRIAENKLQADLARIKAEGEASNQLTSIILKNQLAVLESATNINDKKARIDKKRAAFFAAQRSEEAKRVKNQARMLAEEQEQERAFAAAQLEDTIENTRSQLAVVQEGNEGQIRAVERRVIAILENEALQFDTFNLNQKDFMTLHDKVSDEIVKINLSRTKRIADADNRFLEMRRQQSEVVQRIEETDSIDSIRRTVRTHQAALDTLRERFLAESQEAQELIALKASIEGEGNARIAQLQIENTRKAAEEILLITQENGIARFQIKLNDLALDEKIHDEQLKMLQAALNEQLMAIQDANFAKAREKAVQQAIAIEDRLERQAGQNRFEQRRIELQQTISELATANIASGETLGRLTEEQSKQIQRILARIAQDEEQAKFSFRAKFLRKGSKEELELQRQSLEAQRQAALSHAEELFAIQEELDQAKLEIEEAFTLKFNELSRERIAQVQQEADSAIDKFSKIAGIGENVSSIFKDITDVVTKTVTAFETKAIEDFGKAAQSGAFLVIDFVQRIQRANEDVQRKIRERAEENRKEMVALAQQTGREIGEAITGGLEVDFDKLVQQFIRAQTASRIAETFTDLFATQFRELELGVQREFLTGLPEEQQRAIIGEENLDRQFNELFKVFQNTGVAGLEEVINLFAESGRFSSEAFAPINEVMADIQFAGNATEKQLQQLAFALQVGISSQANLEETVGNMDDQFKRFEPAIRAVTEGLRGFGVGISDTQSLLSEVIPTASFRAVTEPQANEMLRQFTIMVNFLSQISTNTRETARALQSGFATRGSGFDPRTGLEQPALVPPAGRSGGALDAALAINVDRVIQQDGFVI